MAKGWYERWVYFTEKTGLDDGRPAQVGMLLALVYGQDSQRAGAGERVDVADADVRSHAAGGAGGVVVASHLFEVDEAFDVLGGESLRFG